MNDTLIKIIDFCDSQIQSWLPGAMFPSEIAWFLFNFELNKCNILVECGRQDGVSTEIFGRYFDSNNKRVKVLSIDLDVDESKAVQSRERVSDYNVDCITGDIHVEIPKIVNNYHKDKIAIIQDGPKGWEGLATLLAASNYENIALVGQHNLHLGHISRTLFQAISFTPCFIEYSDFFENFEALILKERALISKSNPNRPTDHTSLGLISINDEQRKFIQDSFESFSKFYGIWNPSKVFIAWDKDDYEYVNRLRKKARFTLSRFKKR